MSFFDAISGLLLFLPLVVKIITCFRRDIGMPGILKSICCIVRDGLKYHI